MAVLSAENSIGAPLRGRKGAAFKRWKKLEDDRSSWRTQWQEISDYLLPRRGRYLIESQNTKGRKRNTNIIDNTGGQSLRVLSAGMMSGLTSPARPWFRLKAAHADVMQGEGVKAYLGEVETKMRAVLASSNFYNSISSVYSELGAFGTSVLYRRRHPDTLVNYRTLTAGEYAIAENDYNQVDTMAREFTMTVSQIVEQFVWNPLTEDFEWEKASKQVKLLWQQKSYDQLISVIHMIQPRRNNERDLSRMDGVNRPYADLYMEKGSDEDTLLREDGFDRKPFFAVRWDVLGGDVYGVSPGMEHLGDIKQLQHEQRRKAQAIDKMVNPPMTAPNSLKGKPTTVLPGGTTYVDPLNGGAGFAPAYQVTPRISELLQDIQEVQARISRGFYADLFAMMISSDRRNITATEVAERHEEKLVQLGPVLQRLNSEFLDPIIGDLYLILLEDGQLPEIPEALEGVDLNITYVGLLAQAQEAAAAATMERTLAFAGNLIGVAEDIMDNFDTDESVREYAEILGNSPKVLREVGERDKIRANRAAAAQQAQQMEQAQMAAAAMGDAAGAAKTLSETDSTSPNALTTLLGGTGRGATADAGIR